MGKTLRQRNRKHRKHNKSKKGGILSLENSNKLGMKQLRTGPRRSSSPKPIRKTKTPDNQRTQILCMRLLINGIKTQINTKIMLLQETVMKCMHMENLL